MFVMSGTGLVLAQTGVDSANGPFQTEGNAQHDSSVCYPLVTNCGSPNVTFGTTADDWADIFNQFQHPTTSGLAHTKVFSFDTDFSRAVNNSDNILTQPGGGGGSKDINDFNQWTWAPNKNPESKSDITHAFAAAYIQNVNGTPHTFLYLGMDRFDGSGDATAGFWLVQDPTVGPKADGTFNGRHTEGDLLIVSDFSTGGAVSTIGVYTWHNGALTLNASLNNPVCNPTSGTNAICGIVNPVNGVATGGWSFMDKSGKTSYLAGEFLEVGIDLNVIFGSASAIPCFSTFMPETRSSNSETASGVDFVAPVSFPLCSVTVTKSCSSSSIVIADGQTQVQYNFTGTITNSGSGTVYKATVTDTPPSNALVANSLVLNVPDTSGGLAPGASVTYTGSFNTTAALGSGDKNKVSVTASSFSAGSPQNIGASTADWGTDASTVCVVPITKGLNLSKKCESCLQSVSGTGLVVQTAEAVQVCNSGNTTVRSITVQDCRGIFANGSCSTGFVTPNGWSGITLGPATSSGGQIVPTCTTLPQANTTPTSIAACADGNCTFSDTVVASGTADLGGTVTAMPKSASCPLCPIATSCPTITFP